MPNPPPVRIVAEELLGSTWFTRDRENFHVDGIPAIYADKVKIYREEIRQGFLQIIDDCLDKFEPSHDQYFRQQKQQFCVAMKNNAMIYATTTAEEGK